MNEPDAGESLPKNLLRAEQSAGSIAARSKWQSLIDWILWAVYAYAWLWVLQRCLQAQDAWHSAPAVLLMSLAQLLFARRLLNSPQSLMFYLSMFLLPVLSLALVFHVTGSAWVFCLLLVSAFMGFFS